ncbi:hypothetical protein EUX98_g7945 [Antrodiella citrinella]|uniref:Uncharacterized protein n=1 Tax=Antrodiella citrinella TaxID=2447956 RepID=A0A4S4MCK9_9APHY|nr:hypothetical protein EUX98_g7945 [Antrodiella citrinella]
MTGRNVGLVEPEPDLFMKELMDIGKRRLPTKKINSVKYDATFDSPRRGEDMYNPMVAIVRAAKILPEKYVFLNTSTMPDKDTGLKPDASIQNFKLAMANDVAEAAAAVEEKDED